MSYRDDLKNHQIIALTAWNLVVECSLSTEQNPWVVCNYFLLEGDGGRWLAARVT